MFKKFILQWFSFGIIMIISLSSVQHPVTSGYILELRERADVRLVYLAPRGAEVDAMAFSSVDGFEPIRWTGAVETPAEERKKRRGRQR